MKCPECENLTAFLDGELSVEESERMHAHVEGCAECRQQLVLLKRSYDVLDALGGVDLPSGFAGRVSRRVRLRSRMPFLAAAASLLLVLGITLARFERVSVVEKPVASVVAVELTAEERKVIEDLDLLENYEILSDYEFLAALDTLEGMEQFPDISAI